MYVDLKEYDESAEKTMDEEDRCHYGFGMCIDSNCRDIESCLGCELLYPSSKEDEL